MPVSCYRADLLHADIEWCGDQPQLPVYLGPENAEFSGLTVLDVGCGTGKDLMHPKYGAARERHGIDPWGERIRIGRNRHPQLYLVEGSAESLPYPSEMFNHLVSRVTLPLTNVPVALQEMARVMKPGASLVLTLHDFRYQLWRWWRALKRLEWKTVADAPYVLYASAACRMGLNVPPRPWNGSRWTFQTHRGIKMLLERAGFREVVIKRTPQHFIVWAIRC